MFRFRHLRSRIIFFFTLLLVGGQLLAFFVVDAASNDNAKRQAELDLAGGQRVFERLLEHNQNQLTQAARVLAADYAFREAIATRDSETLDSAMVNHAARIRASMMMLVSLDRQVIADTAGTATRGQPFEHAELIEQAGRRGQAGNQSGNLAGNMSGSTLVLQRGSPMQMVVVPVLAPVPIAWVAIGFAVDDQLAKDLRRLTGLEVTFLLKQGAGKWAAQASTLPGPLRIELARLVASHGGANASAVFRLDGNDYGSRTLTLIPGEQTSMVVVLQRSLDELLAESRNLRALLLALGVGIALASMAASVLLARSVTRPLNSLMQGTARIQQGDYSAPVEVDSPDELGELASGFNRMREEIGNREQEILRLAYEDKLTGLPNRALFNDRLAQAIRSASRGNEPLAVLLMDLDRFKLINDTLGHSAGDGVLREVGTRMKTLLRDADTIARLGGDEYAMLLPGADAQRIERIVVRIIAECNRPFQYNEQPLDIGVSVGIARYPEHGEDAVTLIRHADMAMYLAKRTHSGYATYDPRFDSAQQEHLSMLGELRRAVEHNELRLHYQPKVDLATGLTKGVEALVRWEHQTRGLVPPGHFMPYAEQTGFVRTVTRWVLKTAIEQSGLWRAQGIQLQVAVNISTRDLLDPALPETVNDLLKRHLVPAHMVCLEITESSFMEDPDLALRTLQQLDALGTQISIDDFGTGFSSLAYLKKLPVKELKIDRTFVKGMTEDNDDQIIVRSTIELAHNLGLRVVAEGVEDVGALDQLRAMGCDLAQGYHLSKPLPAQALEAWLAARGPQPLPATRSSA